MPDTAGEASVCVYVVFMVVVRWFDAAIPSEKNIISKWVNFRVFIYRCMAFEKLIGCFKMFERDIYRFM